MVKMVVSDFDDTLMYYPDEFSEKQINILGKLKDEKIKFVIVTGRNSSFFEQFPEFLKFPDYIISSNGGSVYDVKRKKFIFSSCINDDSLNKLIELGLKNDYTFIINELDKKYKYGNLKKIDSLEFDIKKHYKGEQIVFYVRNDKLNEFMETIKEFDDIIINYINRKKDVSTIDITAYNVSKGNGVLWLCDYLKIDSNDVVAFGDGENDISMFKVIDKCICVDNACLELKKYAYDITGSCEENGVFKYINDNILK